MKELSTYLSKKVFGLVEVGDVILANGRFDIANDPGVYLAHFKMPGFMRKNNSLICNKWNIHGCIENFCLYIRQAW